MDLKPAIILLIMIGLTYSTSMVGPFCQYKSIKRPFTTKKIVQVELAQECVLHCLSDGHCKRFNFNSGGDLQCEMDLGQENLTCNTFEKTSSWDYYDRDCNIVSIPQYIETIMTSFFH